MQLQMFVLLRGRLRMYEVTAWLCVPFCSLPLKFYIGYIQYIYAHFVCLYALYPTVVFWQASSLAASPQGIPPPLGQHGCRRSLRRGPASPMLTCLFLRTLRAIGSWWRQWRQLQLNMVRQSCSAGGTSLHLIVRDYSTWWILLLFDCMSLGGSVAQVAIAWLMHKPGVSSVIIGARTPKQLEDNLKSAFLTLTAEEVRVLVIGNPVTMKSPHSTVDAVRLNCAQHWRSAVMWPWTDQWVLQILKQSNLAWPARFQVCCVHHPNGVYHLVVVLTASYRCCAGNSVAVYSRCKRVNFGSNLTKWFIKFLCLNVQVTLLDEKSKVPLPYPYEMITRLNAMSGRKRWMIE